MVPQRGMATVNGSIRTGPAVQKPLDKGHVLCDNSFGAIQTRQDRVSGGSDVTPDTRRVEDLLVRLRRIEGQVRGLQRMIEEKRDCEDILMQIIAVRAALDQVGTLALQGHIDECTSGSSEEARERLKKAMQFLLRLSH